MGNTFGHIFRITTFGESHGKAVGVVIDGCPAGLEITTEEIQHELDRRRPGTSHLTTTRQEKDRVHILSGIFENKTLGTPIALLVENQDHISKVYEPIKDLYRPGHADFTFDAKYGFRDWRGGGRSSARETIGRVAAAAIAKKILTEFGKNKNRAHSGRSAKASQKSTPSGIEIFGYVTQIGKVKITQIQENFIEKNPLRCPDPTVLDAMIQEVETARRELDSVGGIVEVIARGVPAGLGEPVFEKLSAALAQAVMSIPAVKGFEIGDGFAVASRRGSENNDQWINKNTSIKKVSRSPKSAKSEQDRSSPSMIGTLTNRAGGIIGGISTGEDIILRCALKPASSIARSQSTVDREGREAEIKVLGRHDPCVCSRAVPIVEAMVALTLVDHLLLSRLNKIENLWS